MAVFHWDEKRQRWIASVSLGFDPSGKRIVKRGSGRTKTEAKTKLKEVLRDHEDGLAIAPTNYTVADAVNDWLLYGLAGRDQGTVDTCASLCRNHVIPALGARKLRELSGEDVDKWLAAKAKTLSTRTLQAVHSCLNRAVKRAMVRDKVKRNIVELCSIPSGQSGRPSKALTLVQAEAVLRAAEGTSTHAYIVLALLTGARTEELRALTWDHVFLKGSRTGSRLCRRTLRCGGRSGPLVTPRRRSRVGRLPCLPGAWRRSGSTSKIRAGIASPPVTSGRRRGWSSRLRSGPSSTRPTSGVPSGRRSTGPTGSTRKSGLRASCGTASCRCCPTRECRSKRSPGSSGTPVRQ